MWYRALLALVVLYAAVVHFLLLDVPFYSSAEGIGAYHGILGRNFLRLPLAVTKGIPVQSLGNRADLPVTYYSHHPPLTLWTIAASYAVFGEGAWQTRLPFALCTLGTIVLLFVLGERWGRPRAGLVAASVFATMPMVLYYGRQPEFICSALILCTVLSLAAYLWLHERPGWASLSALCAAFTGAGLCDWPAFYLVPVVCVTFCATRPVRQWGWAIGFGMFATLLFATIYAHIVWVATHNWAWIIEEVRGRTVGNVKTGTFTTGQWFAQVWEYNLTLHTVPLLVLSAGWLLTQWGRRADRATVFTRLLAVCAFLHVVVGRQGCFAHAMWWWPVTPAMIMAAALMADDGISEMIRVMQVKYAFLVAAGLMIMFGVVNTRWVMSQFFDPRFTYAGYGFSGPDIAQAVESVAPSKDTAVMVVTSDANPPLWYYADRPLKVHVWSPEELVRKMHDGMADLPFNFTQVWPDPPVALVMPKAFAGDAAELLQYLQVRYRAVAAAGRIGEQYYLFDLTIQ